MSIYYYLVGALAYDGLQELSGVRVGWDGSYKCNVDNTLVPPGDFIVTPWWSLGDHLVTP